MSNKEKSKRTEEIKEQDNSKKTEKKEAISPVKRVFRTASTVLLVVSVLVCGIVVFNTAINKNASFFGYRLFYVITGSMEPNLPIGSMLVVHPEESYEVGDIITFYSDEETIKGQANTHRIIEIVDEPTGRYYITQGDAASTPDDPIHESHVIGKVQLHLNLAPLKSFMEFVTTPMGFFSVIVVPLMLVSVICLKDLMRAMKEELRRAALEGLEEEPAEADQEKQTADKECQSNEKNEEDTTE